MVVMPDPVSVAPADYHDSEGVPVMPMVATMPLGARERGEHG